MLLTLATVKLHLRVDHSDEDTTITLYIGAAEASAAEYLNRTIYADSTAMGTDTDGIVINDAIKSAILLHIGSLYANRENTVLNGQELNMGSKWLLQPYRSLMGV